MSRLLPSVSSWSAAAGRYGSAATSIGRRPSLTMCRASLAVDVVLPEPWRPTIATTAGLPDRWKVRSPADGLLADPCDEVLDDLEVDVRLEQRQAHFAHGGVDVGLADPTAAREGAEGLAKPVAEGVEHGPGGDSSG